MARAVCAGAYLCVSVSVLQVETVCWQMKVNLSNKTHFYVFVMLTSSAVMMILMPLLLYPCSLGINSQYAHPQIKSRTSCFMTNILYQKHLLQRESNKGNVKEIFFFLRKKKVGNNWHLDRYRTPLILALSAMPTAFSLLLIVWSCAFFENFYKLLFMYCNVYF